MSVIWDERHGSILTAFFSKMNQENIRWFVIRGYQGLPNSNSSKDVDVMIEVGKEKLASKLLFATFKEHGLTHVHEDQFGHIHCYIGTNTQEKIAIHIDLVEGYISKGYEVFTFEELYQHVIDYNNIKVLDDFMNGIMLLVYKIFGYHNAKLKKEYQDDIVKAYECSTKQFKTLLSQLVGTKMTQVICDSIVESNFQKIIALEPQFTKALKKYTIRKRMFPTIKYIMEFLLQKINRIIFRYRKYAKTFAVMAPDGTGKTTFLDTLLGELNFYYVNKPEDNRFHVYHFRPTILPNLGEIGEKAGVMTQDKDFTNPHRSKPANPLSSLVRISYYTLDYILGWQKCIRKDVQYDRYSIFDRYSYDFIVDPLRTKLNLPMWIRKSFVAITPQPKVVFFLDAAPGVILSRKQELTLEEISRQCAAYRTVANSNLERFIIINAEQTPQQMAREAVQILLEKYTVKL